MRTLNNDVHIFDENEIIEVKCSTPLLGSLIREAEHTFDFVKSIFVDYMSYVKAAAKRPNSNLNFVFLTPITL